MEGRVNLEPLLLETKDGKPTRAKGAPPELSVSDSEHEDWVLHSFQNVWEE